MTKTKNELGGENGGMRLKREYCLAISVNDVSKEQINALGTILKYLHIHNLYT